MGTRSWIRVRESRGFSKKKKKHPHTAVHLDFDDENHLIDSYYV